MSRPRRWKFATQDECLAALRTGGRLIRYLDDKRTRLYGASGVADVRRVALPTLLKLLRDERIAVESRRRDAITYHALPVKAVPVKEQTR